jgi:hypothetical protein
MVNGIEAFSTAYTASQSFVFASNISEDFDFTTSYSISYSVAKYSGQQNLNSTYITNSGSLKFNWTIGAGFVFRNEATSYFFRDQQGGQNRDYILWNAAFGKKFLDNKGELRISMNDVLDQNKSIRHTVSDIYIENATSNVLGRYALLSFIYTIK